MIAIKSMACHCEKYAAHGCKVGRPKANRQKNVLPRNSLQRRMIDDPQETPYSLPMAVSAIESGTLSLVFSGQLLVRGCKLNHRRSCRSATDISPEIPSLNFCGSREREPVRRSECESRSDIAYESRRASYATVGLVLAGRVLGQIATSARPQLRIHRPLSTRPRSRSGLLGTRHARIQSLLGTRSLP